MKLLLLFLGFAVGENQPPPQPPFVFIAQKPSCTLIDGKLVLSKKWPLGSWEECAHSVLSAAQQLDLQRDQLAKQLAEERNKCSEALAAKNKNPK